MLVSVDLIVVNSTGQALLGYRNNRPAQHTWFVPGGKILKNERIPEAIHRIAGNELGIDLRVALIPGGNISDSNIPVQFMGVYEHLYDDNFAGRAGIGTHYVVLAYKLTINDLPSHLPGEQHSSYRWWMISELLSSAEVHENTKVYFRN